MRHLLTRGSQHFSANPRLKRCLRFAFTIEDRRDIRGQLRHILLDHVPDDLQVDAEVVVNENVPEARDATPRHVRMTFAHLIVNLFGRLVVPPFCIKTEEGRAALQAFEDEVIDRLFVLNAERAKTEAALGRGAKKSAKGKKTDTEKRATAKNESETRAKRGAKGSKDDPDGIPDRGVCFGEGK